VDNAAIIPYDLASSRSMNASGSVRPGRSVSRLDVNVLANLLGQALSALAQLLFIPVYIRVLGIEAYGLVGFYTMLQGLLMALDLGLSSTVNRELARRSARSDASGDARDLVRTLETAYWALGLGIGAALVAAAPTLARHWVRPVGIPADEVTAALRIMGVALAFNWPVTLYQGGLLGLQRQRTLNAIRGAMSFLAWGGSALVLVSISPALRAFFAWHVVAGGTYALLLAAALWRALPPSDHPPRWRAALLRATWRFAAGVGALTVSGLVLSQLDKVLLSRVLDLRAFGYYTLAVVLSNGLYVLINPVHNALFPRFSALAALGDARVLADVYHWGAQVMAVLILPTALVLSLFSFEAVLVWTGSTETAARAAPILRMLAIGTAVNGLMHVPFALQLAHGWTRLGLAITMGLMAAMVPSLLWAVGRYGAVGAAWVWAGLNIVYAIVGVPATHARLLRGEAGRWVAADIAPPLTAALVAAGGWRWLVTGPLTRGAAMATLLAALLTAAAAAALAAPHTRRWLLTRSLPFAQSG
jgi:O-antigen/teichoic acid export membrane protein